MPDNEEKKEGENTNGNDNETADKKENELPPPDQAPDEYDQEIVDLFTELNTELANANTRIGELERAIATHEHIPPSQLEGENVGDGGGEPENKPDEQPTPRHWYFRKIGGH